MESISFSYLGTREPLLETGGLASRILGLCNWIPCSSAYSISMSESVILAFHEYSGSSYGSQLISLAHSARLDHVS